MGFWVLGLVVHVELFPMLGSQAIGSDTDVHQGSGIWL